MRDLRLAVRTLLRNPGFTLVAAGSLAVGAIVGVPFAYLASRSVRTMLYGVPRLDPTAYGAGATLLITVSVFAAFLPARRASRIAPMVALNRN